MATNLNGIIYYKLDSNSHGYPGDITKNCGLRGEEIDGNFNFLRGNDIESISFDENGNLIVKKFNGEVLVAKKINDDKTEVNPDEENNNDSIGNNGIQIGKPDNGPISPDTPVTEIPEIEIPEIKIPEVVYYDFSYDPSTGILTIKNTRDEVIDVEGFKQDTSVYHDNSLKGDGSYNNPLELSNIVKTGKYKPAISLIDLTIKNDNGEQMEALPTINNAKHDRYITRENNSVFGRLYSLSGTRKIAQRLQELESDWHIPSKEEWDIMLNAIDCGNPNHDNKGSNSNLGEYAGTLLKTTKFWEKTNDGKLYSQDAYGFSIYPVGFCSIRGKGEYGSFGETAAFWTSTEEDSIDDMYVKIFKHNRETVGQNTWGENYYLSLRLVKKYNGHNFNETENIDGFTFNCVMIPGTNLIWTKENVGFSQEDYDGFFPDEWKLHDSSIRHFINEWNGKEWERNEILEGESIVLYEGRNEAKMHEWILINGELFDPVSKIKEDMLTIKNEIDLMKNEFDEWKNGVIKEVRGVTNEISVKFENNIATIGFAEDAYFIAGA